MSIISRASMRSLVWVLLATSAQSESLQRWASATHNLELSSAELTTYIATGKLPDQALAQMQVSSPKAVAHSAVKLDEQSYMDMNRRKLEEMKNYTANLDMVRSKAEAAYAKVTEQEKHLSANFVPVNDLLSSLTQTAANAAAKAEVQTMLERLTRMHYKQVSTLDRSATYWLEVAEREKEARRVAEARAKTHEAGAGLTPEEAKTLLAAQQARQKDQVSMDTFYAQYEAQLEAKEKTALENSTPFAEDDKSAVLSMLDKFGTTKF